MPGTAGSAWLKQPHVAQSARSSAAASPDDSATRSIQLAHILTAVALLSLAQLRRPPGRLLACERRCQLARVAIQLRNARGAGRGRLSGRCGGLERRHRRRRGLLRRR
jgi:hypothetical protein